MTKGFCVWLTGLSASGKTTLALLLEEELKGRGLAVEVLDGDIIRDNISKGLGYSRQDRNSNLRRIAFMAHLLTRNGVAVIVAAISPYRDVRDEIRVELGDFIEVFLDCPLEVCIARDAKGLYRKALAGELANFTGVSDPYEPPLNPEAVLHTDEEGPEECLGRILRTLEMLGYVQPSVDDDFSEEEAKAVENKLKGLGYV